MLKKCVSILLCHQSSLSIQQPPSKQSNTIVFLKLSVLVSPVRLLLKHLQGNWILETTLGTNMRVANNRSHRMVEPKGLKMVKNSAGRSRRRLQPKQTSFRAHVGPQNEEKVLSTLGFFVIQDCNCNHLFTMFLLGHRRCNVFSAPAVCMSYAYNVLATAKKYGVGTHWCLSNCLLVVKLCALKWERFRS